MGNLASFIADAALVALDPRVNSDEVLPDRTSGLTPAADARPPRSELHSEADSLASHGRVESRLKDYTDGIKSVAREKKAAADARLEATTTRIQNAARLAAANDKYGNASGSGPDSRPDPVFDSTDDTTGDFISDHENSVILEESMRLSADRATVR